MHHHVFQPCMPYMLMYILFLFNFTPFFSLRYQVTYIYCISIPYCIFSIIKDLSPHSASNCCLLPELCPPARVGPTPLVVGSHTGLLAVRSIRCSRMRGAAALRTGLYGALFSRVGSAGASDVIAPHDAVAPDAATPREQYSAHSISLLTLNQLLEMWRRTRSCPLYKYTTLWSWHSPPYSAAILTSRCWHTGVLHT